MNQTHIHLLINHLPIIGSMLGAVVLLYALIIKSDHTKMAAYILFVISSIGANIAYFTGEGAEESVENLQGVVEATMKHHETFALYALIALIILGLFSVVGFILTQRKSYMSLKAAYIILFVSIISFVLVARTGYLGGQIRHTELDSTSISYPSEEIKDKD